MYKNTDKISVDAALISTIVRHFTRWMILLSFTNCFTGNNYIKRLVGEKCSTVLYALEVFNTRGTLSVLKVIRVRVCDSTRNISVWCLAHGRGVSKSTVLSLHVGVKACLEIKLPPFFIYLSTYEYTLQPTYKRRRGLTTRVSTKAACADKLSWEIYIVIYDMIETVKDSVHVSGFDRKVKKVNK